MNFTPNPIAFTILGVDIAWYGLLIATGLSLGIILFLKEFKRNDYDENIGIDILMFAVPAAILGARIYYVMFNLSSYNSFLDMINIRQGGLAIHGALIFSIVTAYIVAKRKKFKFMLLLDYAAPSLILGQAIGRWGNFFNSEAHGGPTNLPWAIIVNGEKVHPTFLYESIGNFLIFIFLYLYVRHHKKFDGQIFFTYAILYSILRFFVEGLRTDSLMLGPFRIAQIISISSVLVFSFLYYKNIKSKSIKKK